MGLHLPYLPLTIMQVNLPVSKLLLYKSPNWVASQEKEGHQDRLARIANLISFVNVCEPYLKVASSICTISPLYSPVNFSGIVLK